MDQPHRARQLDLAGLDQDDFALDAAKLALRVARGKSAAIDHDAVDIFGVRFAVEFDGAAGGGDARMQFGQDLPWLDMAFVGIEQALAEATLERGFDLAHTLRVEPAVA